MVPAGGGGGVVVLRGQGGHGVGHFGGERRPFHRGSEPDDGVDGKGRESLVRLPRESQEPADFAAFLAREKTKWDEVVRQSGVTMN